MFKKIEKANPFEEILDQIIENIQKGILKKGDALPTERNMAEELGVSRLVVREVLRTLTVLGIIKSREYGIPVNDNTMVELANLCNYLKLDFHSYFEGYELPQKKKFFTGNY